MFNQGSLAASKEEMAEWERFKPGRESEADAVVKLLELVLLKWDFLFAVLNKSSIVEEPREEAGLDGVVGFVVSSLFLS